MRDHGGAKIVIKLFIKSLSHMFKLAAAGPGLFMPQFMLLLKIMPVIMQTIKVKLTVKAWS